MCYNSPVGKHIKEKYFMNLKHRVQNFWKYFETIREDLESSLRQQDSHEYGHILEDLNSQLKRISGCKMEVEMSETGFFEMTFALVVIRMPSFHLLY